MREGGIDEFRKIFVSVYKKINIKLQQDKLAKHRKSFLTSWWKYMSSHFYNDVDDKSLVDDDCFPPVTLVQEDIIADRIKKVRHLTFRPYMYTRYHTYDIINDRKIVEKIF